MEKISKNDRALIKAFYTARRTTVYHAH